jgi:general secretion pathway protein M
MIAAMKTWFAQLSRREQYLVGVAGGLTALVVLIFGIVLPAVSTINSAKLAHDDAVQRRGRIEATVAAATESQAAGTTVGGAAIDLIVTQSAAEQGFDIIKSANAAAGQMTFRMDQARAPALFAWLSSLELQGIDTQSISLRGGPSGSVTVDAQLRQANR